MTTAMEMTAVIGARVRVMFESLEIECSITDVKRVYGRVRYQVEPVSGNGRQWVEETRVLGVNR